MIEIKKRKRILNVHNKELQARSPRDSQSGKKMNYKMQRKRHKEIKDLLTRGRLYLVNVLSIVVLVMNRCRRRLKKKDCNVANRL